MTLTAEAVLFDYWGTLFIPKVAADVYNRRRAESLHRALSARGLRAPIDEVLQVYLKVREECDRIRETRMVEVTAADEARLVAIKLGVVPRPPLSDLVDAYMKPFHELTEPRPGARLVLNELRSIGVKTAIVSNSLSSEHTRLALERHGFYGLFDAVVFSDEVGCRKPCPRIFDAALSALEADPLRSVMVGDSVEEDIAGAKALGITTVLIGDASPRADYSVDTLAEVVEIAKSL